MRRMFSENQVKEIIKKAIESGEIPAGGTKLYIHNISVSGETYNGTIQIISTNGDKYIGTAPYSVEISPFIDGVMSMQFISDSPDTTYLLFNLHISEDELESTLTFYGGDIDNNMTSSSGEETSQELSFVESIEDF